jgi:mono/diheme cytochrome c family protein
MGLAEANGSWLKAVPQADRVRTNPYAASGGAVAAGRNLFRNNCAKCHGEDAEGKGSRPSLKSERIQAASDGELAWLIKNGEAYKGMPGWGGLPEPERWQIVTYLRSLNTPVEGDQQ